MSISFLKKLTVSLSDGGGERTRELKNGFIPVPAEWLPIIFLKLSFQTSIIELASWMFLAIWSVVNMSWLKIHWQRFSKRSGLHNRKAMQDSMLPNLEKKLAKLYFPIGFFEVWFDYALPKSVQKHRER